MTYRLDDDGMVEIVDRRKLTHGTFLPNYVIDLYLPILKFVGLGLFTAIWRLTGEKGSWNKLRDYAKAGGIGYDKLTELLELMIELGLLSVEKPTGADRGKHFRTKIEIFDPPLQVPEQYVQLVREKTIAKWLFEDVRQTELVESSEKVVPLHTKIMSTYKQLLPPSYRQTFNYAFHGRAAKRLKEMAEQLAWTDDQTIQVIKEYYQEMAGEEFWHGKLIALQSIVKRLEQQPPQDPEEPETPEPQPSVVLPDSVHPEWIHITPDHPEFWKAGTVLPMDGGTDTMVCEAFEGGLRYVRQSNGKVVIENAAVLAH